MPSFKMWFQLAAGGALIVGTALLGKLPGAQAGSCSYPCVPGSEDIMKPKEHGTSHTPVQSDLRWGCDRDTADRICNYNRHYAEYSGYFLKTSLLQEIKDNGNKEMEFYDSNSGKLLFFGPKDRTWDEWIAESTNHGKCIH